MTPYNYPEPLRDIERTINVGAQHRAEAGADGVNAKMAEIKALLAEKLAELRALPEDAARRAAEFSWRSAYISSRRNGIYGGMYFPAVIAAAFALGDAMQALEAGLAEIPADCVLAREVRWALDAADDINDYRSARAAADERYAGMYPIHTINNVALTIWGLKIGGDDFTKVIGETVAMGLDNDCTAASAGSIFGAAYGKDAIPEHWTRNFNNKAHSYIIGKPEFAVDDMVNRFTALAAEALASI